MIYAVNNTPLIKIVLCCINIYTRPFEYTLFCFKFVMPIVIVVTIPYTTSLELHRLFTYNLEKFRGVGIYLHYPPCQ